MLRFRFSVWGLLLASITGVGFGATLLREPGASESGSAPKAPFQFVEEESGGTSPKVVVTDANGAKWFVKFGPETKPETFSSNVVRSAGYFAPVAYFVRSGTIRGISPGALKRAAKAIAPETGAFENARFTSEFSAIAGRKWSLDTADLKGTRELAGLKLLIILLASWDVKPDNQAVIQDGGREVYAVTDWGQTMGVPERKSQWSCEGYRKQTPVWIDGIEDGFIYFRHDGKLAGQVTNGVRVSDAKWLSDRLSFLTDSAIRDRFEKSGATAEEAACFVPAFAERLGSLRKVAALDK